MSVPFISEPWIFPLKSRNSIPIYLGTMKFEKHVFFMRFFLLKIIQFYLRTMKIFSTKNSTKSIYLRTMKNQLKSVKEIFNLSQNHEKVKRGKVKHLCCVLSPCTYVILCCNSTCRSYAHMWFYVATLHVSLMWLDLYSLKLFFHGSEIIWKIHGSEIKWKWDGVSGRRSKYAYW